MKVAIDCRMLGKSGIGVFLVNFLDYALRHYSTCQFLLIGANEILRYKKYQNVECKKVDIAPFSMSELLFPVKDINNCDVYFNPNYNIPRGIQIPICCTIHDLLFWDVKDISSWLGRLLRIIIAKRAFLLSTIVFTVSGFSAERIKKHLGERKPIVIVHNALRPIFYEHPFHRNISEKKYLLFVGNVKPHKGLQYLLDAYKNPSIHERYDLIIVGDYNNFRTSFPQIMKCKDDHIHFTGHISDKELLVLMSNAAALVQPSVYEGFGIPPMEALYLGVPVIISDIPVFKEIYGIFPVHFFRNKDSKSLIEAIKNIKELEPKSILEIRKQILSQYGIDHIAHTIMQTIINLNHENSSRW